MFAQIISARLWIGKTALSPRFGAWTIRIAGGNWRWSSLAFQSWWRSRRLKRSAEIWTRGPCFRWPG